MSHRTAERIYWIGGYSLNAVWIGSMLSGHPISIWWVIGGFSSLILFGAIAKRWEKGQSADGRT